MPTRTSTATKLDLRLILSKRETSLDSNAVAYSARVAILGPRYEGGEIELHYPGMFGIGSEFSELEISAYREERDGVVHWWGYGIEYKGVYSLDLRRAEVIVKTLRSIERKMDKLRDRFGYVSDFPSYLAYVADALGCQSGSPFGVHTSEMTYNGTFYKWTDAKGLTFMLDEL